MTQPSTRKKILLQLLLVVLAMLSLTFAVRAQVNLTNGLVAYYPFLGNANDASGNGNNGTLSGSATIITDQWGNASSACNIAGPNNAGRVTIPNSATLQFSSTASFSFWYRLNSNVGTNGFGNIVAGGNHCIFAKDGDAGGGLYCLTSLSGSNLAISVGNVSMTSISYTASGYTTGTWVQVVYIMDATEQRLYFNGTLVATVAGAPNFGTMNTKQLCLGRFGSNWYPIDGALDEFRVYNRVLNTSEISSLAATGASTVSVTNVSPLINCAGGSVNVDFSSTGVVPGNNYTVQLSDAAGSFAYPLTIGTLYSSAATGTISCALPAGLPSGTGYKVRITTNLTPSTGAAGTQSVTINGVLGDIPNAAQFRYMGNSGGNEFYYCTTAQTWTNAENNCLTNGGTLATISNAATNTFITSNVPTGIFIGYTDQAVEGTFVWADGSPTTYTNWNAGEPNNSGNEDYVQLYPPNGVWNDVNGTATGPYVLQLRPAYTNSPVCAGSPLTFFGATETGATYQWSGPNGFSSTQQNPVIANATLNDNGTYTLTITKNGCSATVTTGITVNQSPDAMAATSPLASSLTSGLLLYYPMNGNAADASGNGLNGAMLGGVTAVTDRFGNAGGALQFNGTNGYIDVPDGVYFNGNFTVNCWVKTASYAGWSRVFDFGNGPSNNNVLMALSNGTTGRPAIEIYNGTTSGGQVGSPSTTMPVNQWAMLTYTFSSGTGRLYLNGTLLNSGTQTTPQNVLRTLCYIGRSNWAGDAYANAAFDDFRIYNRALAASEITSLRMEQPDAMNLVAMPAAICPNTASQIKVIGTQFGVSYQLQNASTSVNIGAPQNGNGDTLSFATGNLANTTTFQVVATGSSGCAVTISSVTVTTITAASSPTTTGASRCEPGSVTLSASGAPVGAVYYWYTSATGGTNIFVGPNYTTPNLNTTTTYYVSIYANGCESNRTPVTATINLATAPAVDLYSGLIMWYKTDGNLADSSGHMNNASFVSSGSYTNDRFSQPNAAGHLASNNYVTAGTPADIQNLSTQVSVSMWVNMNYFGGGSMPLLNDWANAGIYCGTYGYWDANNVQQNRIRWRVNNSYYVDSWSNVPFSQWTLITCTFDGSRLKAYQDGVLVADVAAPGTITNNGAPMDFGYQANGSGSQTYNGDFDDIRVYNRALNSDEVLALYFNGSSAFSNTPVCEGGTLQLYAPSITGATYSWTGPNGFSSSQQNPPAITNVTTASAGTYSLVITNANGCVSSPQLNTVVINLLPSTPLTANDTVCSNGNAVLTASGAPAGGSYLWYASPSGGSPISGQTSGTYTIINLTMTDTFYVSIVSAAGCESSARTPVIAYYQNPIQTNLAVSGSSVCANSNATVTIQNTQSGVIYQAFNVNNISLCNGVPGNGGTITLTINTSSLVAGSNPVTIQATQPSCGTMNLSNTANVVINPLPTPFVTASGAATFCTGDSVTLSSSAASAYLWSTGATSQNIVVNQSGNYSVTVTDANGCTGTSAPFAVSVLTPPVATISAGGPTTFCQGDNVLLSGNGGSFYTWSTGATTSSIVVSQAGTYYVIASNGSCADTSASVAVNVNPLPNTSFSMGADTFFCTSGPAYTLTGGSPAGGIYSGPGVSGGQFIPSVSGTGYLQLAYTYTDANGCSNTSYATVHVDVCTGETSIDAPATLSAMPNPTTGNTTIVWGTANRFETLEVFDATGKLVMREEVSGKSSVEISLAAFSDGIYQVKLEGNDVEFLRLVKE